VITPFAIVRPDDAGYFANQPFLYAVHFHLGIW
jgi:hypothetical protein